MCSAAFSIHWPARAKGVYFSRGHSRTLRKISRQGFDGRYVLEASQDAHRLCILRKYMPRRIARFCSYRRVTAYQGGCAAEFFQTRVAPLAHDKYTTRWMAAFMDIASTRYLSLFVHDCSCSRSRQNAISWNFHDKNAFRGVFQLLRNEYSIDFFLSFASIVFY